MEKVLVLYYSLEGHTTQIANEIANKISADIVQIKPLKDVPYTNFSKYLFGGMQVVFNIMPELKPMGIDFEAYNIIFIGSPVWANSPVPAIKSLFENTKIKNKKIAFFLTHRGGFDKAITIFRNIIDKNNIYLSYSEYLNENQNVNTEKAKNWAEKILNEYR